MRTVDATAKTDLLGDPPSLAVYRPSAALRKVASPDALLKGARQAARVRDLFDLSVGHLMRDAIEKAATGNLEPLERRTAAFAPYYLTKRAAAAVMVDANGEEMNAGAAAGAALTIAWADE